jgi:hypothetical protein
MQVKSGQSISFVFCTADPATGMGTEVTSATGKLWIQGVVSAATVGQPGYVTVEDDAGSMAGIRKVSYTVPTGLSEGTTVQCVITATVSGVTASLDVRNDQVVTAFPGELALATSVSAIPTTPLLATDYTVPPTASAISTAVWATRKPGDYPTSIIYNGHGDINIVNWYSGKTWTYTYNGSYQLTSITEA